MLRIGVILAGILLFLPQGEAASKARAKFRCYSSKDTRVTIARLKLANPLMLLRAAARRNRAQPLRSALCRRDSLLMYRFVLLRRDGKVLRMYVNARTGRTLGKVLRKSSGKSSGKSRGKPSGKQKQKRK